MSQNRMTKDADKRAHLDLQLNILAEQESTVVLRLVQKICDHLNIERDGDETTGDLVKETDLGTLAKTLNEKLPE